MPRWSGCRWSGWARTCARGPDLTGGALVLDGVLLHLRAFLISEAEGLAVGLGSGMVRAARRGGQSGTGGA